MARHLPVGPSKVTSRHGTLQPEKQSAVFAEADRPRGTREDILALCFSSDDTLLAAGSYEFIRIWEVDTGNILLSVHTDARIGKVTHGPTAFIPNRWYFH